MPSQFSHLLVLLFFSASVVPPGRGRAGPVPVVLWHGMGDSAAGMTGIASILEDNIPGVYVHRCGPPAHPSVCPSTGS
jgi:hypothetical protein